MVCERGSGQSLCQDFILSEHALHPFGASFQIRATHIYLGTGQTRGLFVIAPELEGVLAKETRSDESYAKNDAEPGEKGLSVLLAESVQHCNRPVSVNCFPLLK